MEKLSQLSAPIYEALEAFRKKRVVPFDVPGHKRGRGNPELRELLGEKCVNLDVNSMKPLDNLCHPVSVIRDAEQLAAEAFGAAHAPGHDDEQENGGPGGQGGDDKGQYHRRGEGENTRPKAHEHGAGGQHRYHCIY